MGEKGEREEKQNEENIFLLTLLHFGGGGHFDEHNLNHVFNQDDFSFWGVGGR